MAVSRQVGHADPAITLTVYADLFDEARNAAKMRDGLDAAFGNALETAGGNGRQNPPPEQPAEVVYLAQPSAGGDR